MNRIVKIALGAAMIGGAALSATAPANAAIVGVSIGVPGVAVGYGAPNACYRPLQWRPAYCFAPAYAEPVYYGATWVRPDRFAGGRDIVVRERFDHDRGQIRDRNDVRDRDNGRRDIR